MPGYLLHQGATVVCMHSGQAQPVNANRHVKVSGQPLVTQSDAYTIAGCIQPPPSAGNGPCATGQWITAAQRIKASGDSVLLKDSQAICAPTGTGLNIVLTQTRVRGM
jgi:hypothetical protein